MGVSGGSIANSSINQGRTSTASGSFSGTITAGVQQTYVLQKYLFYPNYRVSGVVGFVYVTADQISTGGADDTGTFGIYNAGSTNGTTAGAYRYFVA